jgi:non-specific serine/threonine protein kinase
MSNVEITVVTMPPILITSWKRWLEKVSDNVLVYRGTPGVRKKFTLTDKRWILMSHGIFRIDFERIMSDLHGMNAELIVDEAQALKNPKSKLYTMSGTFVQNRRMQMLTGTPTSTPLDCYTYIRLRSPEMYRSYAHFENMHVAERDFFGSVKSYQLLDELTANFAVKSIKRTKQEVHGYSLVPVFPDTTYELDPEHYKLYEKLVEEQLLLQL